MTHPVDDDTVTEEESYHVDDRTARPGGSGPSDSSGTFEPSPNLSARMEKLGQRKIDASWITFPKDAREFRGGHGMVLEARMGKPRASRKKVAIKDPMIGDNKDLEQALGLAIREAEFLAELTHPNIVRFKGFVEDLSEGIIWLVFPWAEDGNLRDFVASQKWEILERISLIRDVAVGLAYLHSREPPICHGDLKSLNVLVFRGVKCRAAITDFGSARHLTTGDPSMQIELVGNQTRSTQPLNAAFCPSTNTITLTGNNYSLRWAAPELLNEDQLSLWSDIWALGWIAYEVVTNSLPFQDVTSDVLVVERVLGGELPSLADNAQLALLHELCSLMTMCWKSNPTERPTADSCRNSIKQMPMWAPRMEAVERVVPADLLSKSGHLYQSRGDLASALECFVKALEKSRELQDTKELVSRLRDIARLHQLRKAYGEAVAVYSEIWEIYAKRVKNYPKCMFNDLHDLAELRQLRDECRRSVKAAAEGRKIEDEECKLSKALCKIAQDHILRDEYEKAFLLYSEVLDIPSDLDSRDRADAVWARAEVHLAQCQYAEAIPLYSEVLEVRTDLGDRAGRANALWGLAEAHRLQDEYNKAISLYSEALKITIDPRKKAKRAGALWDLAEWHRLRDEYDKAVALYSEVLKISTEPEDREQRADALWGLAEMHRLRGEYDQAILLYSEVLKIPTGTWNRKGRADALWGLAEAHRLQDEYNKAISLYSEVLEVRTDLGDRAGRANALWGLAEAHRLQDEYNKAISLYSEALKITTDPCDRKKRADDLWSVAETHRLRDEYDKATPLYSEVLKITTDPCDKRKRVGDLWSVAETHWLRDEDDKAILLYSQLLRFLTDVWDRRKSANALWGFAETYRLRDEYDKAIPLYAEVLKFPTLPWDTSKRADALWSVAEAHGLRGEYDKAIPLYSAILKIPTDFGNRTGRANALWGLADVHRRRSQYDKAIPLYSELFEIRTGLGDIWGGANALWGLAEAYRLRGEYDKAIPHYYKALGMFTNIGDTQGKAAALLGLADMQHDQGDDRDDLYQQVAEILEPSRILVDPTLVDERLARLRIRVLNWLVGRLESLASDLTKGMPTETASEAWVSVQEVHEDERPSKRFKQS